MKTFLIQFSLFGSNQIQEGTFKAKSENSIFNFINKKYGKVDYFNSMEF